MWLCGCVAVWLCGVWLCGVRVLSGVWCVVGVDSRANCSCAHCLGPGWCGVGGQSLLTPVARSCLF